jgi:ribonuclease PH
MSNGTRNDGRTLNQLRPLHFQRGFLEYAEGSCLVSFGKTKVICTASVEDKVPPFLHGSGQGWVTAEYAMLPKSTLQRTSRDRNRSGRAQEISRLIGRSLRSVIDMKKLGERTIYIDCDVIQADGGTRTASISGAAVALYDALNFMKNANLVESIPMTGMIAAVSVGLVEGEVMLDLDYSEDSNADVDFNVVKTEAGQFVEIQGSAEHGTFDTPVLTQFLELAGKGIEEIILEQKRVLDIR